MATKFKYEIKYGLVRITDCESNDKIIKVPAKIDGRNVYKICEHSFISLPCKKLILPNTIGEIDDGAFVDLDNLSYFECHHIENISRPFNTSLSNVDVYSYSSTVATLFECNYPLVKSVKYSNDFKFEVIDEENKLGRIKGFNVRKNELIFPDTINGYKIVELNGKIDIYHRNVVKIHLPKYLKKIPDGFAINLKNEISIELPKYLEEVGDMAFYNTSFSRYLHFPNTLKKIGTRAFWLNSTGPDYNVLVFKKNSNIELNRECFFARNVWFEEGCKISLNGEAIFNYSRIHALRLSNQNKVIPKSTFYGATIITVYGISNIEEIEDCGFKKATFNNEYLYNLKNIKKLGEEAFADCSLERFMIPNDLKLPRNCFRSSNIREINFDTGYIFDTIPDSCFRNTLKLKKINLPKSIIHIDDGAFAGSGIEKIDLRFVETIGDTAFAYSCIKNVKANNLRFLDMRAFLKCQSLEKVDLSGSSLVKIYDFDFYEAEELKSVKLPTTVDVISRCAFYSCKKLEQINLSNVKYIDKQAFKLSGIYLANLRSTRQLGVEAFCSCYNLEKVIISKGLEDLPSFTFGNCSNLKNINLENIKTFEFSAFNNTGLKEAFLSKDTDFVDSFAFSHSKMKKLKFSSKNFNSLSLNSLNFLEELIVDVEEVPSGFIYNLPRLKSIVFTKNCKKINHNAISNLDNLEKIVFKNKDIEILNRNFLSCDNLETLYIDNEKTFNEIKRKKSNNIKERFDVKEFN